MITLNFANIEELIFYNNNIKYHLPQHLMSHYYQWELGRKNQYLRNIAIRALFDFLNDITEEEIQLFEKFLGDKVKVEKFDYKVVKNYKIPLNEICEELCKIGGYNYFTTYRDKDFLYLSIWR